MIDLLVGCPVSHREWVLDEWFNHTIRAILPLGLNTEFVFVIDRLKDPDTIEVIRRRVLPITIVHLDEPARTDIRDWHIPDRIVHMAEVRNMLLRAVREIAPTMFLSVDSDILLHRDAIVSLVDSFGRFDAVGGKCYMSEKGRSVPNYAMVSHRTRQMSRPDAQGGVFPVDVIMGIKLMSHRAYEVDYEHHLHGEDLGWCQNVRAAGRTLGWDCRVTSKHVMNRAMLDEFDERCGF